MSESEVKQRALWVALSSAKHRKPHARQERRCARNPLGLALGYTKRMLPRCSREQSAASPISRFHHRHHTWSLLPSTQHPHPPPTRVLGRHFQVTKPSSEPGSNGRDGICGTGRPTGIQDPGKDWESRAARVMYFCTRLPKPNSYRSHQLSPEIPTPLAPAEASCLVLANGHRLAALRRRVEGPN